MSTKLFPTLFSSIFFKAQNTPFPKITSGKYISFLKEQTEKYARSTTGQQEQGQFQQDKGKQQVNQTFEPY